MMLPTGDVIIPYRPLAKGGRGTYNHSCCFGHLKLEFICHLELVIFYLPGNGLDDR
jgi:hypothetical protein